MTKIDKITNLCANQYKLTADTVEWSLNRISISGGNFNKEINCRHSSLDPDPKRRKLVSFDVKTIVKKYFPEVGTSLRLVLRLTCGL